MMLEQGNCCPLLGHAYAKHSGRKCLCGPHTLRRERGLGVFGNGVLREISGSESDGVTGSGEKCIMRNFMICTAHQTSFE